MLKIVTAHRNIATEVRLSGNISGPWVAELRQVCEAELSGGRKISLDLRDVRYADHAGLELLSQLRQTIEFCGLTPLIAELLSSYELQKN